MQRDVRKSRLQISERFDRISEIMRRIFIINGPGGHGKDEFIRMVAEVYGEKNVHNISSVDQVKEAARILGWEGGKSDDDRRLLIALKQASVRYDDGPTRYLEQRLMAIEEGIAFLHIREESEIEKIEARVGGIMRIHIFRPDSDIPQNEIDTLTEEMEYDIEILNDGNLDDLREKARAFVRDVMCLDEDAENREGALAEEADASGQDVKEADASGQGAENRELAFSGEHMRRSADRKTAAGSEKEAATQHPNSVDGETAFGVVRRIEG